MDRGVMLIWIGVGVGIRRGVPGLITRGNRGIDSRWIKNGVMESIGLKEAFHINASRLERPDT